MVLAPGCTAHHVRRPAPVVCTLVACRAGSWCHLPCRVILSPQAKDDMVGGLSMKRGSGRRMTGGSGRGRTGWSGRRMTKGRGLGIPQEGGWHLGITQGGFPVLGVGQSIDLVFTTFVRLKGHNAASACRVFTKIPANPQRSPSKPHGRGCIVPPRGQCWSRQIRDTRSSG